MSAAAALSWLTYLRIMLQVRPLRKATFSPSFLRVSGALHLTAALLLLLLLVSSASAQAITVPGGYAGPFQWVQVTRPFEVGAGVNVIVQPPVAPGTTPPTPRIDVTTVCTTGIELWVNSVKLCDVLHTPVVATYIGSDGDYVGPDNQTTPNGKPDWHIRVTGVRETPTAVKIVARTPNQGVWSYPYTVNWIISPMWQGGTLDLFFEQDGETIAFFDVTITYADGTSVTAAASK